MSVKMVFLSGAFLLATLSACTNNGSDDSAEDTGCYECMGPNVQTFEVCEVDGKILIDGQEVPELEGITVERVVRELEANEDGEELFENLSCDRNGDGPGPTLPGS